MVRVGMTSHTLLRLADRLGCSLSTACAVHCLATPLFVTFLSTSPLSEEAELPMIAVALALAAITFSAGFVRHTTLLPLTLLVIAGPLMMASRCVHRPLLETSLLVAGTVLLSVGHVVNLRRGHDCSAERACGKVA